MTALTTLANVKAFLGIGVANTDDDALLTSLIARESATIEQIVSRSLASQSYNKRFSGNGSQRMSLPDYPVTAVASVAIGGVAIPQSTDFISSGWFLDDDVVYLIGYTFTRGTKNVAVSFTAGYATIPADIEQACIEMVAGTYRERDRIGMSSKAMAGETTMYVTAALPHSVSGILSQYKKVVPT